MTPRVPCIATAILLFAGRVQAQDFLPPAESAHAAMTAHAQVQAAQARVSEARENARAVRGSITSEMWEVLNTTWLEMQQMTEERMNARGISAFFDWVKERSHLFRGVTFGTMRRDDAYSFTRLGTHIERADSTARILDVKYHVLLPSVTDVGGAVDYYQWSAVLRSVSGFEVYRKAYRNVILPERVAELLILRPDMPRSLAACMQEVVGNLRMVANEQSGETLRLAGWVAPGAVGDDSDDAGDSGTGEGRTS